MKSIRMSSLKTKKNFYEVSQHWLSVTMFVSIHDISSDTYFVVYV